MCNFNWGGQEFLDLFIIARLVGNMSNVLSYYIMVYDKVIKNKTRVGQRMGCCAGDLEISRQQDVLCQCIMGETCNKS